MMGFRCRRRSVTRRFRPSSERVSKADKSIHTQEAPWVFRNFFLVCLCWPARRACLISSIFLPCLWRPWDRGGYQTMPTQGRQHQRFLVAIPAHDEEAGIVATIRSCLAQNYPRELFKVLVIADNCEDQTADLARQEGATVFERTHPTDRSKGHALKSMFEHLAQTDQMDRLDAVVIIDADTVVDTDLLKGLSRYLDRGDDWIQVFDTVANSDDSWRTRLLAYSFGLINGVLLLGQSALGLGAVSEETECAFLQGD